MSACNCMNPGGCPNGCVLRKSFPTAQFYADLEGDAVPFACSPKRLAAAKINLAPDKLFFYVPVPADVTKKLGSLGVKEQTQYPEDQDHVTFIWMPKFPAPLPGDLVVKLMEILGGIVEQVPPLKAKIQGWAYFDGAIKDGEEKTALVALLDCPGLSELRFVIKTKLRELDIEWNDRHGFTPHITLGYLEPGGRVKNLPVIGGEMHISTIVVANDKHYPLPFKQPVAASIQAVLDECAEALEARGASNLSAELDAVATSLEDY